MKNRGQAAMEFLMTYGWAILAAIIVIAVIAIYFKPSSVVGQASIFSPPFTALSQAIASGTNFVDVEIRNSGAASVTLATFPVVTINSPTPGTCVPTLGIAQGGATIDPPTTSYTWNAGATIFMRCTVTGATLTKGNNFNADVSITYTSAGGQIPLISTGTISGKIN